MKKEKKDHPILDESSKHHLHMIVNTDFENESRNLFEEPRKS